MGVIDRFKNFILRILRVQPASSREIVIKEPLTFQENVWKNKFWYRGDPAELEQFFRQVANRDVDRARFWAAVPHSKVRKMHSGIVSIVIDRYRDMIISDLDSIDFDNAQEAVKDLWEEIEKDIEFSELLGSAVAGALSSGDGAFKICIDVNNQYPTVEFYEADSVEYVRSGRKITEIKFFTKYDKGTKSYVLEETYGLGYVRYKLFGQAGKEMELSELEETNGLQDTTFAGDFIMAVPLMVFTSSKWAGRGKALFDTKTDSLDALDEVISQWLDAVRMGRIKRYIPEDMIPRDPDTGKLIEANPFDNDYIAIGASRKEDAGSKIDISQPNISYEAYVNSYANFLDLVLQGVMSPSTLGIDLKKKDNADAQREKEKITIHVRNKITEALNSCIPRLVEVIMMTHDLMYGSVAKEYQVTVKFGEYAAPDFDSTVETVGKAKTYGVMSTDKAVDEMYGDTMSDEEKAEEIRRIKEEQGIVSLEDPDVNMSLGGFTVKEGAANESDPNEKNVGNESEGIQGVAADSK